MNMLDRRKGAVALYAQIENILKEQIENGEYAYGDILPSEKQLQDFFSVSRMTIRQAVARLSNAGYLECARGIGTTVTFKKINEKIKNVISFSQEMKQHGIRMHTTYCSIEEVKADRSVAGTLHIPEGETVYCLVRVRSAEREPMVYSFTFLSKALDITLDPEVYKESLYQYLASKDIYVTNATDTFEAAISKPDIEQKLKLPPLSPVFKRKRIGWDQHHQVIEYTVCYYPGDKYKYTVEL